MKSEDVLMPVKIEESDLPNTVTGEEAETWSDESEKPNILTILDDPKEVKEGRQKELNSLKEYGCVDSCATI